MSLIKRLSRLYSYCKYDLTPGERTLNKDYATLVRECRQVALEVAVAQNYRAREAIDSMALVLDHHMHPTTSVISMREYKQKYRTPVELAMDKVLTRLDLHGEPAGRTV